MKTWTHLHGLQTDGFDANNIITDPIGGACSDAIDTMGEGSKIEGEIVYVLGVRHRKNIYEDVTGRIK
jgi:hypothetical protein